MHFHSYPLIPLVLSLVAMYRRTLFLARREHLPIDRTKGHAVGCTPATCRSLVIRGRSSHPRSLVPTLSVTHTNGPKISLILDVTLHLQNMRFTGELSATPNFARMTLKHSKEPEAASASERETEHEADYYLSYVAHTEADWDAGTKWLR